ncbi:hypothetical protein KC332_g1815 [Hortaea werneckii]|nr:hypothetical protein KC329_g2178 [Hortaea werneckii]KAI7259320.1 hypothetical protein KC335_g11799 [Hortaea werneckii]KAI7418644.1 hypothetical protein KC332_g1815 [Hortaea werneckii]KAI7444306.1 hypothetical protein KC368_g8431 [Hortaea werneckii]
MTRLVFRVQRSVDDLQFGKRADLLKTPTIKRGNVSEVKTSAELIGVELLIGKTVLGAFAAAAAAAAAVAPHLD